jgi:hypothetical protein
MDRWQAGRWAREGRSAMGAEVVAREDKKGYEAKGKMKISKAILADLIYELIKTRVERDLARTLAGEGAEQAVEEAARHVDVTPEEAARTVRAVTGVAADTLRMAGTQLATAGHYPAADLVRDLEAQIRAGWRPVPGSPEPDGGGKDA